VKGLVDGAKLVDVDEYSAHEAFVKPPKDAV
jgi:hypothetical protein